MITSEFKRKLYESTEARCYFDKSSRCWFAIWLQSGHQFKYPFNKKTDIFALIDRILSIQIEHLAV